MYQFHVMLTILNMANLVLNPQMNILQKAGKLPQKSPVAPLLKVDLQGTKCKLFLYLEMAIKQVTTPPLPSSGQTLNNTHPCVVPCKL